MRSLINSFRSSLAAAAWARFDPSTISARTGALLALTLASALTTMLVDWVVAGDDAQFQLYGINSAVAGATLAVVITAMVASRKAGVAELVVIGGFILIADAVLILGLLLARAAAWQSWGSDTELGKITVAAASALYLVWFVGAVRRIFISFEAPQVKAPTLRAVALLAGMVAAAYALPSWPTFAGPEFERSGANLWEMVSAARAKRAAPDPSEAATEDAWAAIELAQPALIDRSLAGLAPRVAGRPNIFVVGVAGWSRQDVFIREIAGSLDSLATRYGTRERAIQLINHADKVSDAPIATISNLAAVFGPLSKRMDLENDILMLVVTSHGNQRGVALEFGPLVRRMLSPAVLKAALDEAGIKNRVLVISACHSGVFIPPFADENSLVVTASSVEATSFGCSNEREWTYFGDAFFNHGLREEPTFVEAFAKARTLIAEWETRDGLKPSNPQIHVGAGVAARLARATSVSAASRVVEHNVTE